MKPHRFIFILLIIFTLTPLAHGTDAPQASRARDIMAAVFDRDDGTTEWGRLHLSSCRTTQQNGKTVCAGPSRTKVLEMVRKDFGPREKDKKTLTLIREPAGERGISFLQYDYQALGKQTDQWLYLTALGKVKRIVSGSEKEPKTGSFFGSEFNYEDMEEWVLEEFTYERLGQEVFNGIDCTVIQALPTPEKAARSNYTKILFWVDTQRDITLKTLLFNRRGKACKRIYSLDIRRVDGIWLPFVTLVRNPIDQRQSIFTYQAVVLNRPVDDTLLTRRSLTDDAFRENKFRTLRKNRP